MSEAPFTSWKVHYICNAVQQFVNKLQKDDQ